MPSTSSTTDVRVFYVRTDDCGEETFQQLSRLMSADEIERASCLRKSDDRVAFALGRALVRTVLSAYGDEPAEQWEFVYSEYGKPELASSPNRPSLHFNISHCQGMVAAGFAIDRAIGVDVEVINSANATMSVARSCFTAEELQEIESEVEATRTRSFFTFWTLKEAYIKATGHGLSTPLTDFGFTLDPLRIQFSGDISDDAENWSFWQRSPDMSHVLAVAAQRKPGETLTACIREVPVHQLSVV